MRDATSRALELIARLEGRPPQSARSLADELGVTERTVRRDVARLRDLGYPIDTSRGVDNGYSLETGAALPPIVVTFDEAIVCTLALQNWQDTRDDVLAASALDKIRAALPRAARTISANVTAAVSRWNPMELLPVAPSPVDTATIGALARACIRRERVTARYASRDGGIRERRLEPHSIIHAGRRWYLVAFDLDRDDWRTFRVDRVDTVTDAGVPARHRDPPAEDLELWFTQQLAVGWQQVSATVRIHLPLRQARRWIAPAWGRLEPETETCCRAFVGADTYDAIARWLLLLDADIEILEPPALAEAFRRVATRATRTARSLPDPTPERPAGDR